MTPSPPPSYDEQVEANIKRELTKLQELLQQRNSALFPSSGLSIGEIDANIVVTMRRIGDAYPDGEERRKWHAKADAYKAGNAEEKEHILMPLAKGLAILIATPFVLAGGVIFAAGAIIYGAGKVVQGLGTLLTGGLFR